MVQLIERYHRNLTFHVSIILLLTTEIEKEREKDLIYLSSIFTYDIKFSSIFSH